MLLKTWSFAKRKNSTKQPTGASRDYTVYLKENTSIERPVFILGTGIDAGVNYCQAMGNYYFIDDIVYLTADQVELHCSLDVLATHKTEIGSYTAYIDRAASTHNSYIIDNALSATQQIISETTASTQIFPVNQTGCFIMRVVGKSDEDSVAGVQTFVLTPDNLEDALDFMFDTGNYTDILIDPITKSFFNPFQYIISLMWFPIAAADIAGKSHELRYGWWRADPPSNPPGSGLTDYKLITSQWYYDSVRLNIPTNFYQGDFRSYTLGYTDLTAFIPGIGSVSLDPVMLSRGDIYAETMIDWITGNLTVIFTVRESQGGVVTHVANFGSYSGQIGVPIQVGQINGAMASIAGRSSGNLVGDILTGITTAATDIVSAAGSVIGIGNKAGGSKSILGDAGNKALVASRPSLELCIRNFGCSEFPNAVYGRPLRANRQISTLSGYIRCMAASIELSAPDSETDEVNKYLNGGFYYE